MTENKSNILLSISFVSNRVHEVKGMFDSIDATTTDPKKVEVLISIDDNDEKMRNFLDEEIKKRKFQIKYLVSKYEGFDNLWKAFNKMHDQLCDKTAYFVQHSNDEMRFLTKGWDDKLEKYKYFFKDEIFRLRLSMFKLFNYFDFKQGLQFPENFPIHTKKWIDITGWCDSHSADAYQQMVSLYLARGNVKMDNINLMFNREIPIYDIEISGLEAGVGEDEAAIRLRADRAHRLWSIVMSKPIQDLTQYNANLLRAEILTFQQENKLIIKRKEEKIVEIYDVDKNRYRKLLYKFPTYIRPIYYDIGIYDAAQEPIDILTSKIEVKKPRWLKKCKLHILWPLVKYIMIFKIALERSKK